MRASRLLDDLRLEWAVAGGIAANFYRGEARLTGDMDIMLVAAVADMAHVASEFQRNGWTITHRPSDQWLIRAAHPEFGRIDLIAAETEYQRIAIRRAKEATIDGDACKILAAEDVIVLKMIANRYKDLADVESILEARVKLDRAYLDDWLAQWDVPQRFRAVEDRVAEHRAELDRPSRQSPYHCR